MLAIWMIRVKQVAKTVELIRAKGGKVTREPGPVKGGYKFEIIERPGTPEPFAR
jgi:lactoylglutathione lyase